VGDTILVVDDEPAVLFSMREYFALLGYSVDCAKDASEASCLLGKNAYTFVIADLRLNRSEEGLDVIRMARDRSPNAKLVLLTAYGSPQLEAKATGLGVNVCLYKPQPLNHLADVLRSLARGQAARSDAPPVPGGAEK
jgi:DNA-binding response OmpR family regulator